MYLRYNNLPSRMVAAQASKPRSIYFLFHARRIFSSSSYIELDIFCDCRDRRRRSFCISSNDGFRTGSLPRLRNLVDWPAGESGRMGLSDDLGISGDLQPSGVRAPVGDLAPAGESWRTALSGDRDRCAFAELNCTGSDCWRRRSAMLRSVARDGAASTTLQSTQ